MTVMGKAQNKVKGLKNDRDALVTNRSNTMTIVVEYFKNLFERDTNCDILVALKGKFLDLNDTTRRDLMRLILEEEIQQATFDMALLKALGPDGMHVAFYQRLW